MALEVRPPIKVSLYRALGAVTVLGKSTDAPSYGADVAQRILFRKKGGEVDFPQIRKAFDIADPQMVPRMVLEGDLRGGTVEEAKAIIKARRIPSSQPLVTSLAEVLEASGILDRKIRWEINEVLAKIVPGLGEYAKKELFLGLVAIAQKNKKLGALLADSSDEFVAAVVKAATHKTKAAVNILLAAKEAKVLDRIVLAAHNLGELDWWATAARQNGLFLELAEAARRADLLDEFGRKGVRKELLEELIAGESTGASMQLLLRTRISREDLGDIDKLFYRDRELFSRFVTALIKNGELENFVKAIKGESDGESVLGAMVALPEATREIVKVCHKLHCLEVLIDVADIKGVLMGMLAVANEEHLFGELLAAAGKEHHRLAKVVGATNLADSLSDLVIAARARGLLGKLVGAAKTASVERVKYLQSIPAPAGPDSLAEWQRTAKVIEEKVGNTLPNLILAASENGYLGEMADQAVGLFDFEFKAFYGAVVGLGMERTLVDAVGSDALLALVTLVEAGSPVYQKILSRLKGEA